MSNELEAEPDGQPAAFVDPWSRQPQHQGDIPDWAQFVGAWDLDVGIDTLYEAVFIARDDRMDRLWSLTMTSEKLMIESLEARERGDHGWAKAKLICGCVAGAARDGTPSEAAKVLLDRLFRALVRYSGPRPPYTAGLLTSEEIAAVVRRIVQEFEVNAQLAEAADRLHQAPILKLARDLKLNPRPAGHNSAAWIADCVRRSHFIMISPSSNQFGCGYCKRKGGPAELRAFCESVRN